MNWFKELLAPDEVTIQLACIHCAEVFEQTVKTRGVQILAGVCESCMRYGQMTESAKSVYLEFLRRETEATRKEWIVRS